MFTLRTPRLVAPTSIDFASAVLEAGHCGLFRAPLHLAAQLMPSMAELIATVPVSDPTQYELDIKVHMLMAGQYPCIPNWHTDMVGRDESGLRFDQIEDDEEPMLLWISDGPETEFLARQLELPAIPAAHHDIARQLNGSFADSGALMTQRIQPNCWWSMDRQTPHRGTVAAKSGWRVFARVTPLALAPRRPVTSVIRRHAQVYLDASHFAW